MFHAVYGDNFFKRSQYTVSATLQQEGLGDGLQKTEKSLIEKRAELLAFEKEFKKSRAEFEAVRSINPASAGSSLSLCTDSLVHRCASVVRPAVGAMHAYSLLSKYLQGHELQTTYITPCEGIGC